MPGIADWRQGVSEQDAAALILALLTGDAAEPLGSAAAGTDAKAARADHVHAHGSIGSGDLHPEYQRETQRNAANGYAGIGADSRVAAAQAPVKSVYAVGGGQALAFADLGLSPNYVQLDAVPGFGALLMSSSGKMLGRLVIVAVGLTCTAGVGAYVTCDVETGVGSGAYQAVTEARLTNIGGARSSRHGLAFYVPPGMRYRFTNGSGVGVTETVLTHSWVEV